MYLVRIFSAARCAGFRQKKSPGRVGRCQWTCNSYSEENRSEYNAGAWAQVDRKGRLKKEPPGAQLHKLRRGNPNRGRLSCQPPHLFLTQSDQPHKGAPTKRKAIRWKRDFFGGYAEAFSEEFLQILLAFWTFSPFSEDFQVRKQRAFYPNRYGKNEVSTRFFSLFKLCKYK